MKKIILMIGIAGSVCLFPSCKKSDNKPDVASTPAATQSQQQTMTKNAKLSVLLDSKVCVTPQHQYTSATLDIQTIMVYNTHHGWETLTTVPGAWDLVSLQSATVPANLTTVSSVHAGTITKIKLIIGDNNNLVVNDQPARCYNISTKEIILDMEGEMEVGSINQILLSIDICGNIIVEPRYNDDPCYTLNPVIAFKSFTQMHAIALDSSNK